ncbi:MAG: Glucose-1-phosphate thymidylyltransferase [Candidatus Woesebacteria bacterium GW2011_GWA1_39_8]|uniref:glucose-1-phosphate thymidylyltransferase n=1 Tax=Candidatus Woesebacteria bacterium GW2011_GWA1_39_8 TaxID=1618552 RepID=A0A0G0PZE4_9BACT|nr:MAG: Glucose-1-phosphate thymidylyltransferase [Candidatus Woesebacteria bacterium GW2011_GWA1_39_8]
MTIVWGIWYYAGIVKGVVLAGGLGTRLYPLTYTTNKHLLPIYDQPMIFYPIRTLVKAGIKSVMVVVSGPHSGQFIQILKNGKELGLEHLEYGYQENPMGGLADALKVAEDFADDESVTLILGDNTTDADVSKEIASFEKGSIMFLKKVSIRSVSEFRYSTGKKSRRLWASSKNQKNHHHNMYLPVYMFLIVDVLTSPKD